MKPIVKILSVGASWGFSEATMMFLVFFFPSSIQSSNSFYGIYPTPFGEGFLFAVLISFASGIVLADATNIVEALLIASLVAFVVFIIASIFFFVAIPVHLGERFFRYTQGERQVAVFGTLSPILFLVGFLTSAIGAFFGNRLTSRRRRRSQLLRPLPPL